MGYLYLYRFPFPLYPHGWTTLHCAPGYYAGSWILYLRGWFARLPVAGSAPTFPVNGCTCVISVAVTTYYICLLPARFCAVGAMPVASSLPVCLRLDYLYRAYYRCGFTPAQFWILFVGLFCWCILCLRSLRTLDSVRITGVAIPHWFTDSAAVRYNTLYRILAFGHLPSCHRWYQLDCNMQLYPYPAPDSAPHPAYGCLPAFVDYLVLCLPHGCKFCCPRLRARSCVPALPWFTRGCCGLHTPRCLPLDFTPLHTCTRTHHAPHTTAADSGSRIADCAQTARGWDYRAPCVVPVPRSRSHGFTARGFAVALYSSYGYYWITPLFPGLRFIYHLISSYIYKCMYGSIHNIMVCCHTALVYTVCRGSLRVAYHYTFGLGLYCSLHLCGLPRLPYRFGLPSLLVYGCPARAVPGCAPGCPCTLFTTRILPRCCIGHLPPVVVLVLPSSAWMPCAFSPPSAPVLIGLPGLPGLLL